jgi:hypothetical protein
MGARMSTVSDSYIEAKTGSQVSMRLKGGAIASPTELPMRIAVVVRADDSQGTVVQVTTSDVVVIGFKFGMKRKYERAFADVIEQVRVAVGAQT